MAKLTYYGHSAVAIESDGTRILIDPFFTDNPAAPVKADDVSADFIVLTHAHFDHVGDTVSIAKRCKAVVATNYELAMHIGAHGIEVSPMNIGGSVAFPFGRVKLTQAIHGSTLEIEGKPVALGVAAGVVIAIGGRNIYHAGDTCLFSDMRLIGEDTPLDAALLPIGDRFTMGIEDAAKAAGLARAKLTLPIHFNTWPLIEVEPAEFVKRCEAIGQHARAWKPGETIEI